MRLPLLLTIFALLSLGSVASRVANAASAPELTLPAQVECGTYRVKGLLTDRRGLGVLRVYPLTTAEWELPVIGVPTDQALALEGIYVTLEVEVFRLQKSDSPRSRYLKMAARSDRNDALVSPVRKVRAKPCGTPLSK